MACRVLGGGEEEAAALQDGGVPSRPVSQAKTHTHKYLSLYIDTPPKIELPELTTLAPCGLAGRRRRW
jgi:hypothetical protein